MTDAHAQFVVEGRDARGRWKYPRSARPMSLADATALAADLDEHGNDARVVPFRRFS